MTHRRMPVATGERHRPVLLRLPSSAAAKPVSGYGEDKSANSRGQSHRLRQRDPILLGRRNIGFDGVVAFGEVNDETVESNHVRCSGPATDTLAFHVIDDRIFADGFDGD